MKRGYLIVFTGIDGSGKTTQVELLVKSLQKDGIEVSYVWSRWEPFLLRPFISMWKKNKSDGKGSTKDFHAAKDEKQKLLNNPVIRYLWLLFFFIDYGFQIFRKIRIGLLKRQLIISDRIFYDSVIDQAINLGKRKDWLLNSLDSFWSRIFFPKPDLVIYIDCPERIAFSRKTDAPNLEYLLDRRRLYKRLADRFGWITIDGTQDVDKIAIQIRDAAYKKLSTVCQKLL